MNTHTDSIGTYVGAHTYVGCTNFRYDGTVFVCWEIFLSRRSCGHDLRDGGHELRNRLWIGGGCISDFLRDAWRAILCIWRVLEDCYLSAASDGVESRGELRGISWQLISLVLIHRPLKKTCSYGENLLRLLTLIHKLLRKACYRFAFLIHEAWEGFKKLRQMLVVVLHS